MAFITRYDPFRDLARLQDEMSRVFDERLTPATAESMGWTPACDIFEDTEEVVIRAALAGVDPKNVDIRFENGTLTLRGERKMEKEDKKENYVRLERWYGSFTRAFSLPTTVDADKVKADFKNGLLRVSLPRKEETKPKAIKVKVD